MIDFDDLSEELKRAILQDPSLLDFDEESFIQNFDPFSQFSYERMDAVDKKTWDELYGQQKNR